MRLNSYSSVSPNNQRVCATAVAGIYNFQTHSLETTAANTPPPPNHPSTPYLQLYLVGSCSLHQIQSLASHPGRAELSARCTFTLTHPINENQERLKLSAGKEGWQFYAFLIKKLNKHSHPALPHPPPPSPAHSTPAFSINSDDFPCH